MKSTMASLLAAAIVLGAGSAWAEMAPGDVKIVDGMVAESVSGAAGDPARGADIFKNRRLGNCLACHANSAMSNELFHGDVGPPIDGAADRWSEAELRAIIVNSKAVFGEQTVMPGFYTLEVGKDVREDLVGKTVLTPQEVEDVVAYVGTLKE